MAKTEETAEKPGMVLIPAEPIADMSSIQLSEGEEVTGEDGSKEPKDTAIPEDPNVATNPEDAATSNADNVPTVRVASLQKSSVEV